MVRKNEADHQLKQANDTTTKLHNELRQAKDREIQLQIELDKMNDYVNHFQMQKKEFDATTRSSATAVPCEQEMETRHSKIFVCHYLF